LTPSLDTQFRKSQEGGRGEDRKVMEGEGTGGREGEGVGKERELDVRFFP